MLTDSVWGELTFWGHPVYIPARFAVVTVGWLRRFLHSQSIHSPMYIQLYARWFNGLALLSSAAEGAVRPTIKLSLKITHSVSPEPGHRGRSICPRYFGPGAPATTAAIAAVVLPRGPSKPRALRDSGYARDSFRPENCLRR